MFGRIKNIMRLAWRNIWRNPRRTGFTLLALIVGVMCLVFARSFVAGVVRYAGEAVVNLQAGHIRVARKEYLRLERIMPKNQLLTHITALKKNLAAASDLNIIAMQQRLNFTILCNHGERNETAMAVGIEPLEADKTMFLSRALVEGHYFNSNSPGPVLIIGKPLAHELGVSVGSELLLVTTDINYSTFALPFKVAGIFETGFAVQDKRTVYIPLAQAQQMLDCPDAVHELLLFLKNPDRAREAAQRVEKILGLQTNIPAGEIAVVPWQEHEILKRMMPLMEDVYEKILAIIMIIVALVILNTMLMAVMERYHEIGVMKAMGLKNGEIFAMILTEATYIGLIGYAIGGIFGAIISGILEKTGINLARVGGENLWSKVDFPLPFLGTVIHPNFSYTIMVGAMVFGLVVALLAVVYPAVKSAYMSPVEAFRSQLKV